VYYRILVGLVLCYSIVLYFLFYILIFACKEIKFSLISVF